MFDSLFLFKSQITNVRCSIPIILLALVLSIESSSSPVFEIRDLQGSSECFSYQASQWTGNNLLNPSNLISTCDGAQILGGYQIFGAFENPDGMLERNYADLASHTEIRFAFTLYVIDGWGIEPLSLIDISVDGTVYSGPSTTQMPPSLCGDSTKRDMMLRIFGKISHNDEQLTFKIGRNNISPQAVGSFGVRDLVILFATESSEPVRRNLQGEDYTGLPMCGIPSNPAFSLDIGQCPSAERSYPTEGEGDCYESCEACKGGLDTDCYQCKAGYSFDGERCIKCDSPCLTCTLSDTSECTSCETGYILYQGTCLGSCPGSLVAFSENCQSGCTEPRPADSTTDSTSTDEESGSISDLIFLAPMGADTVTFVTLTKMMQYVRYLNNVQLPSRLERLSTSPGRNVLSIKPTSGLTLKIYSWFTNNTMTTMMEKQNLHPKFLANFGGELFVLIIIFASAAFFYIFTIICKKCAWSTLEAISTRFQDITTLNLCMMIFGTYLDDIILYTTVEYTTLQIQGATAVVSFIASISAIMTSMVFLYFIYRIVSKSSNTKVSPTGQVPQATSHGEQRSLQIFTSGFRDKPYSNKLFYLIYVGRAALPMLFAMMFYVSPIAQTVLQVLSSLLIVGYILYMRPLASRINQYQLAILEGIVLIMNISMLILVIMDHRKVYDTSASIFFGDVVILGNVTINVLVIVVLVIKFVYACKEINSIYKKNRALAMISCVNILALPLQQGAFGFEQLIGPITPPPPTCHTLPQQSASQNVKQASPHSLRIYPLGPVAERTVFNKTVTNGGIEEENSGIQTTERLGQSSARLLLSSSQILNQSQPGLKHTTNNNMSAVNMSMNNESIMDLPTQSPKHKKALSTLLKKFNNNQGMKGHIPVREPRVPSQFDDSEREEKMENPMMDQSGVPAVKKARREGNSIFQSQSSVDASMNFKNIVINQSTVKPNKAQIETSGFHLKQDL